MRTMVGKKDVFLSYPHVDIRFAKRMKVSEVGVKNYATPAGVKNCASCMPLAPT